jgi:hypothetical protein
MKTIEIDDEVFAYLQSKAFAYIENPNLTLRRILGIEKRPTQQLRSRPHVGSGKKPKADLNELVRAGLIREGQRLTLRDYQGRDVEGCESIVSHGSLLWNGKRYSMSDLARALLKQQGYKSDSVRGPMFWFNEDGVSIKDIWEKHLANGIRS